MVRTKAKPKKKKGDREPKLWWESDGYLYMDTPYHSEFVSVLKACVPKDYRIWREEDRVWGADPEFFKTVRDLLHSVWPDLEIPENPYA